MNYKVKQIIRNARVMVFLVLLVLAIVAINPRPWADGVAIRSITANSAAIGAGIQPPSPTISPVNRERILEINNMPIKSVEDYYNFASSLKTNQSLQIKTNKALYRLKVRENIETIELNETEKKEVEEAAIRNETINGTLIQYNETIKKIIDVPKKKEISKGPEDIGIGVFNAPKTNIRKGLDLQGGTRVLLQPETILAPQDLQTLIDNMEERLNVYGLSDLIIRDASDLSGNQYILVEIAGATEEEIRDLLARQGKFEAKITNKTVFVGGQDIVFVCRSADCAGIDPNYGCSASGNENVCRFRFSISITPESAQRQADITRNLKLTEDGKYLVDPLELYLDDTKVDELNIGAELQGSPVTEIQISGSGSGFSQQEAIYNTLNNMKRLQTVLITGSLPIKLNIVKIDAISPLLGEEFLRNAIIAAVLSLAVVSAVIFARYRRFVISIPIVIVSASEIILLLGVAAIIGWNIDLAAVAGIIITVGTGVNHQIVITDETLRGERFAANWKERIKRAFSIIMTSYFTVVVALIPLIFAGAGLLKGFAIITILGASIGVFISRPVFARVIEILLRS